MDIIRSKLLVKRLRKSALCGLTGRERGSRLVPPPCRGRRCEDQRSTFPFVIQPWRGKTLSVGTMPVIDDRAYSRSLNASNASRANANAPIMLISIHYAKSGLISRYLGATTSPRLTSAFLNLRLRQLQKSLPDEQCSVPYRYPDFAIRPVLLDLCEPSFDVRVGVCFQGKWSGLRGRDRSVCMSV